jgi:hypothetical protein
MAFRDTPICGRLTLRTIHATTHAAGNGIGWRRGEPKYRRVSLFARITRSFFRSKLPIFPNKSGLSRDSQPGPGFKSLYIMHLCSRSALREFRNAGTLNVTRRWQGHFPFGTAGLYGLGNERL